MFFWKGKGNVRAMLMQWTSIYYIYMMRAYWFWVCRRPKQTFIEAILLRLYFINLPCECSVNSNSNLYSTCRGRVVNVSVSSLHSELKRLRDAGCGCGVWILLTGSEPWLELVFLTRLRRIHSKVNIFLLFSFVCCVQTQWLLQKGPLSLYGAIDFSILHWDFIQGFIIYETLAVHILSSF